MAIFERVLSCADAGGSVSAGRHQHEAHVDRWMTGRALGCASESELECTRRRNARTGGIDVWPNIEAWDDGLDGKVDYTIR